MVDESQVLEIQSKLEKAMTLEKCYKCGCMRDTLEEISKYFNKNQNKDLTNLKEQAENFSKQLQPKEYSCLGCKLCWSAEITNDFNDVIEDDDKTQTSSNDLENSKKEWPTISGEYFVIGKNKNSSVAVITLTSVGLAEKLYEMRPKGLSIVGKLETENIGIEKIIKNVISNSFIKHVVLTGKDSVGHCCGETLIALIENGIDEDKKILGSTGKKPILKNVTFEEIGAFRNQVKAINMIDCEDVDKIIEKIQELSLEKNVTHCNCEKCNVKIKKPLKVIKKDIVKAVTPPKDVKLDKAGYFVVIPETNRKVIIVEHYSYDNKLLRTIEGLDSKSIYWTILQNNWVSELSHACYIGMELTKAELSIKHGFKYVQDGA